MDAQGVRCAQETRSATASDVPWRGFCLSAIRYAADGSLAPGAA